MDGIKAAIVASLLAVLIAYTAYIYHHIEENSNRSKTNELRLEYTRETVDDHERRLRELEYD